MSKLALPPLAGMPPDVQAAFRSIQSWAQAQVQAAEAEAKKTIARDQSFGRGAVQPSLAAAINITKLLTQIEGSLSESHLIQSLNERIDLIDGPASMPGSVANRVGQETLARTEALSRETRERIDNAEAQAEAILRNAISAHDNYEASLAVIAHEALTREEADVAEALERDLLAAQFRGDYTGNDITQITTGLFYQERIARATQDDALAQQITLLSAGAGEQFDWKQIWYFDAGTESWGGNGTPTASGGWLRPADHATDAYVTSPSPLGIDGNKYGQSRLRVRKVGSPVWDGYLWWKGSGDTTWDTGRRIALTEPTYDANNIGLVTVSPSWPATLDAIRLDFSAAQTVTDYFEIDWVAIGRPSPGASSAQLLEEQIARAAADSAEVTARQALSTKITGLADPASATLASLSTGLLFEERNLRSTADSGLATDISLLAVTVADNYSALDALILDEETARIEGDTATASQVTTLVSATRAVDRKLTGDAETLLRDVLNNQKTFDAIAVAKREMNTMVQDDLSAEASERLLLAARIDDNASAILTESTARSTADSAISSTVTTLQTTVGEHTTSLEVNAESINGLSAQYTVKIDNNGHVTGFGLASTPVNGVPFSEFAIVADRFSITGPGAGNGNKPFVYYTSPTTIDGVTYPAGMWLDTAYIKSLTAEVIKAGTIISDSIIIGGSTVTLGQVATSLYTPGRLASDLATGAARVLSGAVAGESKIELGGDGSYALFSHKDANIAGLGAGYSGDYRCALGITSSGIIMGRNNKTTGAWENQIVIDAATGTASFTGAINATSGNFTGTITAGSVISGSVTTGGTSLDTIRTNAANGASAYSGLASKLDNNAATIMASAFALKTPNYDSTSAGTGGMAMYDGGIVARKRNTGNTGWDNTLTIGTDGNITLSGNISGSTGTFAGNISTSGHIIATGSVLNDGYTAAIHASTFGAVGLLAKGQTYGVHATAVSGNGVSAYGNVGVAGSGVTYGIYGVATSSSGTGVKADDGGITGAFGLDVVGKIKWSGYSINAPTGGTSTFLRNDGTWATPSAGSASWGGITGTLSSQTDLNSALNGKLGTGAQAYDSASLGGHLASQYPVYAGAAEAGTWTATFRIPAIWNGVNIYVLAQAR